MEPLLDLHQLAELLHRPASSILSDRTRNPAAVPPAVRAPGTRRLLWRESDVERWLARHVERRVGEQPASGRPRRLGRPTKAETVRAERRQGVSKGWDWAQE